MANVWMQNMEERGNETDNSVFQLFPSLCPVSVDFGFFPLDTFFYDLTGMQGVRNWGGKIKTLPDQALPTSLTSPPTPLLTPYILAVQGSFNFLEDPNFFATPGSLRVLCFCVENSSPP